MDNNPPSRFRKCRPGISQHFLERAGVRHVEAIEAEQLVGYCADGTLIPYLTPDGSPILTPDGKTFNRLRLDRPSSGAKYLSPKGGGAQIYSPPGLRNLLVPDCVLGAVEGEFKALAMVEGGFPCIGIGGISSACRRNGNGGFELLPDLAALIAEVRPSAIAFIGDGDTALIPDFSREATKIAQLVSIPVKLPRIPVDGPKGLDDLREVHGENFPAIWLGLMEKAESITRTTKPAALSVRLLIREIDALGKLRGEAREKAKRQIVKLGAAYFDESLELEEITAAAKQLGLGKQVFRSAVKTEIARNSAAAAAARQQALAKDVAERKEPALIFDGVSYWRREMSGEWGRLTREDARLHLGVMGFNLIQREGEPSAADCELHRIQQTHRVNFAGPFCGRPAGIHTENGITVLATRGPRMIETKPGKYPTIQRLIGNLLGEYAGDPHAVIQRTVFVVWLKLARIAIREQPSHRPGQVLALVGPPDCGKSFVQSAIVTPALGGRVADPTLFFTGGTTFNSELWGAEHLAIGDKGLGEDGRERARLRDELKRVVASSEYPLHRKHAEGLTFRPVWRVTLSANDDPESAISLPALDASFADKITYLKCFAPPQPFFDPHSSSGREDFARAIAQELPAFLHDVDAFEIPADLAKGRFGLIDFHHPAILDLLENGSALMPLSEVLDAWITRWEGADHELSVSTTELSFVLHDRLRGIASSPIHLGRQLARLADTAAWRGRLVRDSRRIGNKQLQTVWKFRKATP